MKPTSIQFFRKISSRFPTKLLLLGLILESMKPNLQAGPVQNESTAQTLLLSPSARASSLSEALTAVTDDVSAAHYNPATVTSLRVPQINFLYQRQFEQESYSHMAIGGARQSVGAAFSAGYFDIGEIELYNDNGASNVNGQRDYFFKLAGGRKMGSLSLGLAGTYFVSTLIESKKATAFASDIGLLYEPMGTLKLGASLQNVGTKIQYNTEKEDLPELFRAGASYKLDLGPLPTTAVAGWTHNRADETSEIAGGLEFDLKPLALRAGGKKKEESKSFSVGAGIRLNNWSFDYNIDLLKDLNSEQKFSLKYRFEPRLKNERSIDSPIATKTDPGEFNVSSEHRIYTAQEGDTWGSVADKFKAKTENLKQLNKHLTESNPDLKTGEKLLLP